MASQKVREIETLLIKLHEQVPNAGGDAEVAKDTVVDLSETLTASFSYEDEDLCLSLLFSNGGLTEFCKVVAKDARFVGAKKDALELFKCLIEKKKIASLILKYANHLEKLCRTLYNADNSSKVRCNSLELFCVLLTKAIHQLDFENFDINKFVDQLCLDIKGNKGSLVLYNQMVTLGVLSYSCPEKVGGKANLIFKVLKEQLSKRTGHQPDLTAAAGAVRGISFYFNHFPQGSNDNSTFYSKLYPDVHKLLNPELKLSKREVQRAALELIHRHGSKFADDLLKHHEILFKWLSTWCRSLYREDHKAGLKAMDTFVVVIANTIELQEMDNRNQGIQVFKFLLKEFNEMLESSRSASHISLAVKGYGLLAGACKIYLTSNDVFKMFSRVLAVSHQGFFQSSEMLETKVANLPSYIESLGFIISKLDNVTVGMMDNLLQLSLALVENFPYVSQFKTFLAYRAFFTLFASLERHNDVYRIFLHNFVYHFIVHTCSHEPLVDKDLEENEGYLASGAEPEEDKWTSTAGLKGKLESYKNYLPLWKAFLSPEAVGEIKVTGQPATVLTKICHQMYEEFFDCSLEISEKLDLKTFKPQQNDYIEEADVGSNEASSDLIKGLKAKTPKDFQVYMNLCCLMEAVVPLQNEISLNLHLSRLFLYYVKRSSLEPLVSTHYSIVTLFLSSASQMNYFEAESNSEMEMTKHLLTGYVLEVLQRCKQYKDQLLASCLTLILRLPLSIVKQILPKIISPIQISLHMGLSYLPIARITIAALQLWIQYLDKEEVRILFPNVLPFLLPYLRSKESLSEAEMQTRIISVKMSLAKQRRKVDKKKMEEGKRIEDSEMRKVQLSILQLLGHLDQSVCFSMITNQRETILERSIAWDTQKHVQFAMPFQQLKLEIYFDEILPTIIDRALNSSDRQTKIASCELLHSLIILMIGTGHQQSEKTQKKQPMTALYLRVFQAVFSLSCDSDQVTRQLFLTLTYQLIHWFTNNKSFEHPDTTVLLQVIMDGIITSNDPALRDLSAHCLAEFLKWSRKQSRSPDQSRLNIKSVLKRIISFCNHPNAYKRLGGCLAWNTIYREVREDEKICDEWMILLLTTFITCLIHCQDDDPLIGIVDQCEAAISHVQRILKERNIIFNKPSSSRRVINDMGKGTLPEVLEWFLHKISSYNEYVRHSSMELIMDLAPITKGYKSGGDFIKQQIKRNDVDIVEIIERSLNEEKIHNVEYKDIMYRIKNLLASLDAYVWILSKNVCEIDYFFSKDSVQLFSEINYFLTKFGNTKAEVIFNCTFSAERSMLITSSHIDKLDNLRCTAIVRIMDFVYLLLINNKASEINKRDLLNENFRKIILLCVFDPSEVGFNIKDTEVTDHLPQRLQELLSWMLKKLPKSCIALFQEDLRQYIENVALEQLDNLTCDLDANANISPKVLFIIKGLKILHLTGWDRGNLEITRISEKSLEWVEKILFNKDNGIEYLVEVNSKHHSFIKKFLHLGILFNSENRSKLLKLITSTKTAIDTDERMVKKGTHVLNVLGDIPFILVLEDPPLCVCHALEMLSRGEVREGVDLLTRFMKLMVKNAQLKKEYSEKLLQCFVLHWETLHSTCGGSTESKIAFLNLVMAAIMADTAGVISNKLKIGDDIGKAILSFFKLFICDPNLNLSSKARALKLLPFFLIEKFSKSLVNETLQNFRLSYLPLKFSEFEIGSLRERELKTIVLELLFALELTADLHLLEFIVRLFCGDEIERYDDDLQKTLNQIMTSVSVTKQMEILKFLFDFSQKTGNQILRVQVLERVFVFCLHHASDTAILNFFVSNIVLIMSLLNVAVIGRSDEQLKNIVTKYVAFSLIQILYSKLSKEQLFAPGSQINSAYEPKDTSGKELTKEILKRSVRTAKGELRHDLTHQELRRKCSCSSYNALIAVLSNVQDQLKFYNNFLFSEVPAKDEAIFECLIDLNKKFVFDIEVSFDPTKKDRFVAVRKETQTGEAFGHRSRAGTIQYLASHYLHDSSLREDVSQYDFSSAVVLTQSSSLSLNRNSVGNISEGGMSSVRLDQSDFNSHEVMPNLIAIIRHLIDKNIMTLYSSEEPPRDTDMPQWMTFFKSKLENRSTNPNVKLFILRLIMNTEEVFGSYGNLFVEPMLSTFVDGVIGKNINYFIADLFVTILSWGKRGIPTDKNLVSEVLRFLVSNTPHKRAEIFKYNLKLIKTLVETWKDVITAPREIICSFLEVQDGEQREVETALQISGIFLANGIAPFSLDNVFEKERFISSMNSCLTAKQAAIYSASAEVMGLYLKFVCTKEEDEDLVEKVSQNLLKILSSQSSQNGQALSCVYFIHKHYPKIVHKLINRLLAVLPRLYGIHKERILQCLVSYSPQLEDIFTHLKEQNILDSLTMKEAKTQLVCLELLNASLPRLLPSQIQYFLPGILAFEFHAAPSCRELMYEILIWIYDKYSGNEDEDCEVLAKESQIILLKGTKDEDVILRQYVKNFWIQRAKDLSLTDRLVYVLEKLYTNETDECFLMNATHILLEATHSTADFMRPIFPYPLTECIFREMKVSPGWKAQHTSMIPLFVETQSSGGESFDSLVSMTQDGNQEPEDGGQTSNANLGPQVTQNYAFSTTQNQESSYGDTYNWVTGSTLDTAMADQEFKVTHAPQQSSSAGLFFTENKTTESRRNKIGNSSMRPLDEPDSKSTSSTKSRIETALLRRRFVTNQDHEKQTIQFARQEEIRRKIRYQLQKERKMKREAQVTIYRQYRVGELPDVQIPHKALISPLQALAERDESVASELFKLLSESIINCASGLLSPEEDVLWKQKVFENIKQILGSSEACYPHIVRPLLQLVMVFYVDVNPEDISSVCTRNNLEPLGILILERQHMKQKQSEREPVRKKARREYSQSNNNDHTSLWLNIAEMYKNLSNWDSVLGILKSEIGELKQETILALEAESEKNHFEAYKNYVSALKKDDWSSNPSEQEQQVWEEWFITSAENLGQWEKIEEFIEGRFLSEGSSRPDRLNKLWDLPRQVVSFALPSLINSKLMKILQGSRDDGGLCQFISESRKNERQRLILENEMGLQSAVLAVNQEEMELARSLLRAAQISLLSRLVHCSLLSSRSLTEHLKSVQALSELQDFIKLKFLQNKDDSQENEVKKIISIWKMPENEERDNIVQTQFTTSYRDMYLHFLRPLIGSDYQFLNDIKAASHVSMIKLSLANSNPHLAQYHLTKLEHVPKDKEMECQLTFLKTEASIIRAGLKDPQGKLQYSVEAWCKYLGKVDDHLRANPSPQIEAQYLMQESLLCFNICEAIRDSKDSWNPKDKYMTILANKFKDVNKNCSKSWFEALLKCSHNGLTKAGNLLTDVESGIKPLSGYKDVHETITSFYEKSLEEWMEYVNNEEFTKAYVRCVLKGMTSGSRNAHHMFPRLIYLLEQHPYISQVFVEEVKKVPLWMFLLWLSHILIYLDKAPGPSLHPIIKRMAETYPQAVIYPFEVSNDSYEFTGPFGPQAKRACEQIKQILSKNSLIYNFISAISLVHLPHTDVKDILSKISKQKDKTQICNLFKECVKFLKPEKIIGPNEKGAAYLQDNLLKKAYDCLAKQFGQKGEKLSSFDINDLKKLKDNMNQYLQYGSKEFKNFSRNLNYYSPWLASFNASNYKQEIEIPGQYQGLSKPMSEYHTLISSFSPSLMLMESLRVPMRITINGSDEKEYSFLVKSGEDLRTDQRVETLFSLMNNTYDAHCSGRLSCKPLLITYQVIPLTVNVGLLEWVNHTQPFMNFMSTFVTDAEKKWVADATTSYQKNKSWEIGKTIVSRGECVKAFEKIVNALPWDLMRRGLIRLAVNHEGFFYLRNAFISSYATLCISHWLLGIGDRHLSNILFNYKTGYVVGIDFGHHFESATQFLPVPELMPFRLTNQIMNVMQPLGIKGQFRETMISCLSALKKQRRVICAAVEAFVKEPTKDWLYFVASLGNSPQEDKLKEYSMRKMDDFRMKLFGGNPMEVFSTAVSSNMHVKRSGKVAEFRDIVTGKGFSERSRIKVEKGSEYLSVAEQVDILIDQATDPNILGRSWHGWKPFL